MLIKKLCKRTATLQNQVLKNLSIKTKGVSSTLIHPCYVKL